MEIEESIGREASRFGVSYLYPYQRLVIANVLDAASPDADPELPRRQLVILPTGAGKSLCFQLPAALLPGITLVIYPLLGLQADQMRRLAKAGIEAVSIRGGMGAAEKASAFDALAAGKAKLALSNPETLQSGKVLDSLKGLPLSHLVVDEAHCVAEWGDSFRPAYRGLGGLVRELDPAVATAFTATASPPVLARVTELLFGGSPYRMVSASADRPNIAYGVRRALSMGRSLRTALSACGRPAIVFVRSRKGAEIVAEDLAAGHRGFEVRFYHAGLDKEERASIEAWFMSSADGVLCATTAYGMGMDKSNVRTVIHFGPPSSIEAYLQESGRAGRDGAPAKAILLADQAPSLGGGQSERRTGSDSARERVMAEYIAGGYGCRRTFLLRAMGESGADEVGCGSCDSCDGMADEPAEGAAEIAGAIRAHARRFDRRGLATFLAGSGAMPAAYSGALSDWGQDELQEAVKAAVDAGMASEAAWLWSGRLTPRRRVNPREARRRARPIRAPRPRPEAARRRGSSGAGAQAAMDWRHS